MMGFVCGAGVCELRRPFCAASALVCICIWPIRDVCQKEKRKENGKSSRRGNVMVKSETVTSVFAK